MSSSTAYLRPALKRPNLELRTQALVHRVIIQGGRAVGVEYERDGRTHTVHARREVILSGGAYNSPHLLMLSGIGPGKQLQAQGVGVVADRPGVGRNLSEHATVSMEFLRPRSP